MEGRGKPRNFYNFAAVNRGISQNFPRKTVGSINHSLISSPSLFDHNLC